MGKLSYESELKFWQENLQEAEKGLKEALIFSKGVVHSGIMDYKNKIKKFENKIKELEQCQK